MKQLELNIFEVMKYNLLDSSKPQFQKKLLATLRSYLDYSRIDKTVAKILNDIRKNGTRLYVPILKNSIM